LQYELTILALEGRNDLAYVHSAYEVTVTPPGATEPVGDRGKGVRIRLAAPASPPLAMRP
jgi:hypothetical protein